jgi:hypothetical protein
MPDAPPLPSQGDHPMALQDVARRGATGEAPTGMPLVQQGQQFLAAPVRVPAPSLEDRGHDFTGCRIRRAAWPAGPLLQPGRSLAQVALDPLVPGLTGDAVELAQLRDRSDVAKMIGNEPRPLVHG